MNPWLLSAGILLVSYLIGSIPFGLLVVKWSTGRDVRHVESGRTGGTNAMRAAGFWAGLLTALLDISKSALTVRLAIAAAPHAYWLHMLAPVAAIIGHNHSIYLPERTEEGKWRLRGGAGGTPAVGGAVGLWWPSIFILVPVGALLLFGVGYASVATMSIGVMSVIIFAVRAAYYNAPWAYVWYGILAEILILWALRPNIKRLMNGTERLVGWRAKRRRQKQETQEHPE
ncbi:MAG TPA: glycerol-3-phosphate acyltransferase [Chloroflexi bacterium]|nr:glycerol-3-phosphate acyltransferase [Chloroflexota bacterium]